MQQTGYYDQMKNRLNRYHGNKEYKESLIFKNVFVWYLLSLFVIEFTTFSSYSLWSFCLLRASNRKEKVKHIKLILCEELALLSVYMILNGIFEVFRWIATSPSGLKSRDERVLEYLYVISKP